jgi:hypothetical protein
MQGHWRPGDHVLARDIHDGRIKPDIQRQEADLYLNPRRIR